VRREAAVKSGVPGNMTVPSRIAAQAHRKINILPTAAMHTPLPRWVIFVRSTRFRRSRHVRFAPIASEPSHRSDSTRCANSGREQMQQATVAIRSPRRRSLVAVMERSARGSLLFSSL
jgi:hypothetical protein